MPGASVAVGSITLDPAAHEDGAVAVGLGEIDSASLDEQAEILRRAAGSAGWAAHLVLP